MKPQNLMPSKLNETTVIQVCEHWKIIMTTKPGNGLSYLLQMWVWWAPLYFQNSHHLYRPSSWQCSWYTGSCLSCYLDKQLKFYNNVQYFVSLMYWQYFAIKHCFHIFTIKLVDYKYHIHINWLLLKGNLNVHQHENTSCNVI